MSPQSFAMSARETENNLLNRCAKVALGADASAHDKQEANVFRVAAMVIRPRFPGESARLMRAGEDYFSSHPSDCLPAVEVVRNGWVFSLPRLRDMLSLKLLGQ